MKKIVLLAAAAAFVAAPLLVGAQTFFPSPGTSRGASFSVGYAASCGNPRLSLATSGNSPIGDTTQYDWTCATSALYAELALPFYCQYLGHVTVSLGAQIPGASKTGNEGTLISGMHYESDWNTNTFWGNFGIVQSRHFLRYAGDWYTLLGIQWDCWQTSFDDRSNITPTWLEPQNTDTADVTVNMFIPQFGFMHKAAGLTTGAVVSPFAFGRVIFNESYNNFIERRLGFDEPVKGAYYVSAFGEYALPTTLAGSSDPDQDFTFSIFARFIWTRAHVANAYVTRHYSSGLADHEHYGMGWHRALFVVGGTASLNFSSPW